MRRKSNNEAYAKDYELQMEKKSDIALKVMFIVASRSDPRLLHKESKRQTHTTWVTECFAAHINTYSATYRRQQSCTQMKKKNINNL